MAGSYAFPLRAGAAMAVGVSCAGTGMRAALDLLAPLLTDAVDFVRQGALIANALVLMQQPESKAGCLLHSKLGSYMSLPMRPVVPSVICTHSAGRCWES